MKKRKVRRAAVVEGWLEECRGLGIAAEVRGFAVA